MSHNVDPDEIKTFDAISREWWDPTGPMKPLHQLNPLRLQYIEKHTELNGTQIVDVGCGGGILSESLARAGATVTGIDMSNGVIEAAKQHAVAEKINIDYQCIDIAEFSSKHEESFDIVTCMELLEHVPNPPEMIKSCMSLLKPGGTVFFSTINRNAKAFLTAIVGAEYLLRMLPRGTHHYDKFIRPSELTRWAETEGLTLTDLQGISYHPLNGKFDYSKKIDVNYLTTFKKL